MFAAAVNLGVLEEFWVDVFLPAGPFWGCECGFLEGFCRGRCWLELATFLFDEERR
ncbi:hypothetical protein HanPSC8_Chr16g0697501 [Helianthus annuus]|nr:hypothetical protein HanPSC8_Chr16g0697501 [Helianthus annuus]